MSKYTTIILFSLLLQLSTLELAAQKPIDIERKSSLALDLPRNSTRNFSLVLAPDDLLSLQAQAEGSVNIKVVDPKGQVIHQALVGSQTLEWQKRISEAGVYSLQIESTALLLHTRVVLNISLYRPEFSYGHPSMDSLVSKRSKRVMVDGPFEIIRKSPKTYTFNVLKGDTLSISLSPNAKFTPSIEVTNDQGELVFAAFSSETEKYQSIPILADGAYTIQMSSEAFLPKTNFLKVEIQSPNIYIEKPGKAETPAEAGSQGPQVLYDTIPEIYLDTVFFLGAQRDIINPSTRDINITFEDPSSIIEWLILYGSGDVFFNETNELLTLVAGEPLAAGAQNILAAYGMGFLKKLPKSNNNQVQFVPSASIRTRLKPPLRSNYATIGGGYGNHTIQIKNMSKSAGQRVLVQVVIIRKMRLE